MASNPDQITAGSVVPMSTVLDALEGVLSEAERQALLTQLIDVSPQGVAPGDLITAELFNAILGDINALKIRVARLEGAAGTPVIIRTVPADEFRTNAVVSIIGNNFNAEPRRNTILFGDQRITPLRQGSDTSLSFLVPFELEGLPRNIDLAIENEGLRSNTLSIRVIERDFAQSGDFDIGPVDAPSGVMIAGQSLTLSWPVTADTALPDEVTFSLLVGSPQGASAADWQANVRFDPASPASFAVGQTRTVSATIAVPAGATRADLSLAVSGQEGIATGTSQPPVAWRAGETLEVSSASATLVIEQVSRVFLRDQAMIIGGSQFDGVRVPRGAGGLILLELRNGNDFTAAGQFTLTAAVDSNAGDWSIAAPIPASVPSLLPGGDIGIRVDVTNTGGSSGEVTFLRVTARQTASGANIAPFTTFALIPLQLN